ncbi:MAG: DUF4920 domain-containing protein [Saprospiraceae bacterium]
MLKNVFFLTFIAAVLTACGGAPADNTAETGEAQTFGKAITADGAIPYGELAAKMEGTDSIAVKVKGTVQAVCQMKGCWMNVSDAAASEEMLVQFEDYGFFVPKDISGRQVVMDGYAYRAVTPVEELRHYAEDEGKSKEEIEAITEPLEEVKFMASGVLLLPEDTKQ